MKAAIILSVSILGTMALVIGLLVVRSDGEEEERFANGLTPIVVPDPPGIELSLFRAGDRLTDAAPVTAFTIGTTWLAPGRYFVLAAGDGDEACYPVPLSGYRCGPDEDGAFAVTVRPVPAVSPPPEPGGDSLSGDGWFAYVPSGSFLLGDRQNPLEPHYVWLTGYFMARFETPNRAFMEFRRAPDGYGDDSNWTAAGAQWKASASCEASALLPADHPDHDRFGKPDQPVTMVSWYEANAYCRWLTRRYGGGRWLFTLPTDAEWEKAARGPDNFDYGLGMGISDAEASLYNWRKNPDAAVSVVGIDSTRRGFPPNRYGLYHATGNVAEWTQSVDRPYNREHPYADDDRNHDDTSGPRTVRGGSWYSAATSILQIPYRDTFQPEHRTRDTGFRVVAKLLP